MTRPHTLGTVLHDGHLVGLHPILDGARHWACRGIYAQTSLPRPISILLLPLAAGLLGGGGGWVLAYPQSLDFTPIFVVVAFFFSSLPSFSWLPPTCCGATTLRNVPSQAPLAWLTPPQPRASDLSPSVLS